ncbi:hypothetical protein BGW80DRAFT_1253732 [Lactifluus volemus]|nr:hypothetical protein BGW80DRAFT_1253732 [Lactifluus volemus]
MSSPHLSPSPFSPSLKLGNLGSALRAASRKQVAESGKASSSTPPTPSVAPSRPSGRQDEAGSNSQDFSPPVFTGTPISQPPSTPALLPPPADTAGGVGKPSQDPVYFPPKKKLALWRALSVNDELSVFDIHNLFRRRWFLSRDHLMANAISAQKAEDGKFFGSSLPPSTTPTWSKTLNGEAPKAFFDLTKGPSLVAKAQKEKKRLARKRNRASRREHRRAAEEAAGGRSQRACKECGRRAGREERRRARVTPNPPPLEQAEGSNQVPDRTPHPPRRPTTHLCPRGGQAARTRCPHSGSGPATYFEQPIDGPIGSRHSACLNTAKKRGTRKRVMESVIDKP